MPSLTILYHQQGNNTGKDFYPSVTLRKWCTNELYDPVTEYILEAIMVAPWGDDDPVSIQVVTGREWVLIRKAIALYDSLIPTAQTMTQHYVAEQEDRLQEEVPY